jgi:hypothetical protein
MDQKRMDRHDYSIATSSNLTHVNLHTIGATYGVALAILRSGLSDEFKLTS